MLDEILLFIGLIGELLFCCCEIDVFITPREGLLYRIFLCENFLTEVFEFLFYFLETSAALLYLKSRRIMVPVKLIRTSNLELRKKNPLKIISGFKQMPVYVFIMYIFRIIQVTVQTVFIMMSFRFVFVIVLKIFAYHL